MNESKYVKECIENVESQMEWGSIESWDNSKFESFSEILFEKTGILVGVSSLIRLLAGKKTNKLPQPEAKDAIARFTGYSNWQRFIEERNTEYGIQQTQSHQPKITAKKSFRIRMAMYILSGAIALLMMIYLIIQLLGQKG